MYEYALYLNMLQGFTRREVRIMTGMSFGSLSYLARTNMVVPEKIGKLKCSRVLYTPEQVLEIKIIKILRSHLSLTIIREIIAFLKQRNYELSLFNCKIVIIDKKLYFIEDGNNLGMKIFETASQNNRRIRIQDIGAIGGIFEELHKKGNRIMGFQGVVKGTILEKVDN